MHIYYVLLTLFFSFSSFANSERTRIFLGVPSNQTFYTLGPNGTFNPISVGNYNKISIDIPSELIAGKVPRTSETDFSTLMDTIIFSDIEESDANGNSYLRVKAWGFDGEGNRKELGENIEIYSDVYETHREKKLTYYWRSAIEPEQSSSSTEGGLPEECIDCYKPKVIDTNKIKDIVLTSPQDNKDPNKPILKRKDPKKEATRYGACEPYKEASSFKKDIYPEIFNRPIDVKNRRYCYNIGDNATKNEVCQKHINNYPLAESGNCRNSLILASCQSDKWRGKGFKERYSEITEKAEKIGKAYGFPANLYACLATRESENLNPNARTSSYCRPSSKARADTATGLFQINQATNADLPRRAKFEGIVKGNPQLEKILKNNLSERSLNYLIYPDKTYTNSAGVKTKINKKERSRLIRGQKVKDKRCTSNPDCAHTQKELFNSMINNVDMQLLIASEVLRDKASQLGLKSESGEYARKDLKRIIANYYVNEKVKEKAIEDGDSSIVKDKNYEDRILGCMDCMKNKSPDEAYRCLVLSRNKHRTLGEPTLGSSGFNMEYYEQVHDQAHHCSCDRYNNRN